MILVGVSPGGHNKFAATTLFFNGHMPAAIISTKVKSGVDDVLADVVGLVGEWGELSAVAIAAPLTWAGVPSGWRGCDLTMRKLLPAWVPRTWWRPPNVLPGAIAVQGPALAWALAREIKGGILPQHRLYETHPRTSLALIAGDLKASILGYRQMGTTIAQKRKHIVRLFEAFTDAGVVKAEVEPPNSADELDALICALTALGAVAPESGLVVHELEGGEIRPVGKRQLAVLKALP
jgi:predicted nuclease with RNAse H fold